ncbi:MAG: desulfoferrodoxin [Dehalococcoidia bacterium]|nr:desulfoferrodoxin [Dehalococcoidia bacterium]
MNIITSIESLHGDVNLANETGKRYFCGTCGAEFIVTKGGEGIIACHGKPLVKK